MSGRPLIERLLERVVTDAAGCWLWTGATSNGYGVIGRGPRGAGAMKTHRAAYELMVGPVPAGLDLDHLCRVRRCCNPEHLEPVTRQINLLRGVRKTQQTHCARGHELTPENTRQTDRQRVCRTCERDASRRYHQRKRGVSA